MKKLTMDVKFEIAVQIGQLFDINETLGQEDLVNAINEKIENLNQPQAAKAGKWYENKELEFSQGNIVQAINGWAKDRLIQIEKPSAKVDAYKGFLINPKTNEPQGTLVTVDAKDIQAYAAPVEEKVEEEVVA